MAGVNVNVRSRAAILVHSAKNDKRSDDLAATGETIGATAIGPAGPDQKGGGMRKLKVALFPTVVALVQFFGTGAAHGYFRTK